MKRKAYVGLFVVLLLVYLGLNLLIAPDKASLAHYHLSMAGARAITISFVVPISLIYLAGAYGAVKMNGYTQLIKKSPEAKPLNTVSIGLMVLVMAQLVAAILGNLVGLISRHETNWIPTMTIINNYLLILLPGVALGVMAYGAWRLSRILRPKNSPYETHVLMLLFIILSSFYSYFIVSQPLHNTVGPNLYFMPKWTVVLTIAIPYLFIWYLGIFGAYQLYAYQRSVKGLIYKGSLIYVAAGVSFVVLSLIAVRFLVTISAQLSRLKITPILLIVYGFLALLGAGFGLIAWGAHKLRRIEEV